MVATLARGPSTERALDQLVRRVGRAQTERCAFCYGKLPQNRRVVQVIFRSTKDGEMGPRAAHVGCAGRFLYLTDWLMSYRRGDKGFEAARRSVIAGLKKIPSTRVWDRRTSGRRTWTRTGSRSPPVGAGRRSPA